MSGAASAVFTILLVLTAEARPTRMDEQAPQENLGRAAASHFARLALKCVRKEYPNKIDHVLSDVSEVRSPRALHPAFYGCYDWHSSVHAHWMLVRLRRLCPDLPEARDIRAAFDESLAAESLREETRYITRPH